MSDPGKRILSGISHRCKVSHEKKYGAGIKGSGAPGLLVTPNVRVKPPAEAGSVSLVRDDASWAADQAYAACRSGSA